MLAEHVLYFASFFRDAVFSNCSAGASSRKQDFQIILIFTVNYIIQH